MWYWTCDRCNKKSYYLFDKCEHCSAPGGMPKGSGDRTRDAAIVLDRKEAQDCTLALTLRNKARATKEQKRRLDDIIGQAKPNFKKARDVAADSEALQAAKFLCCKHGQKLFFGDSPI